MATYTERLANVSAAIDALIANPATSVRYNNREYAFVQLKDLQNLEERYRALAAMEMQAVTPNGGRFGITYITPRDR